MCVCVRGDPQDATLPEANAPINIQLHQTAFPESEQMVVCNKYQPNSPRKPRFRLCVEAFSLFHHKVTTVKVTTVKAIRLIEPGSWRLLHLLQSDISTNKLTIDMSDISLGSFSPHLSHVTLSIQEDTTCDLRVNTLLLHE